MLVYNAQKQEDGDWTFDLKLVQEEVDFLVNFGVTTLMTEGLLAVQEQEEEQDVPLPNKPLFN